LKKGLDLELDHEQMRINHSGGFSQFVIPVATAIGVIAKNFIDAKIKKLKLKKLNGII
jgi:hypothetical protein